jgi:hypothetical protein
MGFRYWIQSLHVPGCPLESLRISSSCLSLAMQMPWTLNVPFQSLKDGSFLGDVVQEIRDRTPSPPSIAEACPMLAGFNSKNYSTRVPDFSPWHPPKHVESRPPQAVSPSTSASKWQAVHRVRQEDNTAHSTVLARCSMLWGCFCLVKVEPLSHIQMISGKLWWCLEMLKGPLSRAQLSQQSLQTSSPVGQSSAAGVIATTVACFGHFFHATPGFSRFVR